MVKQMGVNLHYHGTYKLFGDMKVQWWQWVWNQLTYNGQEMLLGKTDTYVEDDISKEAFMVAKRTFLEKRMVFSTSLEDHLPRQLLQLW